ncbi:hypothetical protein ACLB2K_071882 [Fragaria x ananassa]
MADKRDLQTPPKKRSKSSRPSPDPKSSSPSLPPTPLSATPRRSTRRRASLRFPTPPPKKRKAPKSTAEKKQVFYKKAVYDGGEFEVGDDVYVKRREDEDEVEVQVEEQCRVCFKSGKAVMIECDDCLCGFHLKCLKPPLKEVPQGDWVCGFCEARRLGKEVQLPTPPKGKKLVRTFREKLLSSDLWAARIESIWKELDGTYWCRVRWYVIPEETEAGRQPHNLRREIYRTNDSANIEMESILQHCFVMNPKEYAKANEGDDVFLCEYEYDIHWYSFKRLAEIDDDEEDDDAESDEDWKLDKDSDSDTEEEVEFEEESTKNILAKPSRAHELAANSHKGRFYGLQKIGMKQIPKHVRCHKQTALERAKSTLLLASLPKSLPCRDKEMLEISAFIKGAISDDKCVGRCLYIHGVPGTGKTMSVLAVMRNLRSEVDAGSIRPYCFIEINGLKLASPENIYRVIYEALSGHRVGWKKALHLLNERFSNGKKFGKEDDKPCILLIDELDLLVTRNQSVLYNILDWPTKPNSKLVVIGIANTMDLPEKLLPRISSRMGIQRLCFGPYNYRQLQEIISSRLRGIDAFEKQAIEFASRKVAAISGDARRALEICRRAAEITDYRIKKLISTPKNASEGKALVGMSEVEAAIQEMFQAPHIQVMKTCSKLSKIYLTAMVYELYKTGMGETTFEKLAMTVYNLCTSNGEAFPGHDTLLKVGCKLGECRIILCESGAKHRLQKLQLNFPSICTEGKQGTTLVGQMGVKSLLQLIVSVQQTKQAHAHMIVSGLTGNTQVMAHLLCTLSLSSSPPFPYSLSLYHSIPSPSVFASNNMIRCFSHSPSPPHSLLLYSSMLLRHAKPNNYTFTFLLQACSVASALPEGAQVHAHAITLGFADFVFVRNALIHLYSCCSSLECSTRAFEDNAGSQDIVTWNSMLSAFVRHGQIDNARKVFDKMPKRDVVSWSSVISGYVQNGMLEQGLECFKEMRDKGVRLNEATLVSVLSASAQMGLLEHGRLVHSLAESFKFPLTVSLGTALIDMYAKCGCIQQSRRLFSTMPARDIWTWNVMICGLASHGLAKDALQHFERLTNEEGLRPANVTFIGVLGACSRAGLVSEGRHYFKIMTDKYGIQPGMEHYGCMVDLLGRAGFVDEAAEMIDKMTVPPDPVLWATLLGACRMHGSIELGEKIGNKLIQLDPTHDGHYVQLASIYAKAKKWEDVVRVRRLMTAKHTNKAAGWSLIEAQGKVHKFVAGDREHERSQEIYKMLETIVTRIAEAGYSPNVSSVLHDIGEEEKENAIKEHSERLAMAFGMLVTGNGDCIRIVKNLRVCEDCHEVSKIISNVFGREIIVRDGSRFHHFKEGKCSCLDYW